MRRRCGEDASEMRHEKNQKCEKMRRDAPEVRRLFLDSIRPKVLAHAHRKGANVIAIDGLHKVGKRVRLCTPGVKNPVAHRERRRSLSSARRSLFLTPVLIFRTAVSRPVI